MAGVNNQNLEPLERQRHIEQSLVDLLTTIRGERTAGRQNYGLDFLKYIGRQYSVQLISEIIDDVIETITFWEPRVNIVNVTPLHPGGQVDQENLKISVTYTDIEDVNRTIRELEVG